MSTRKLPVILLFGLIVLVLAGCSGEENEADRFSDVFGFQTGETFTPLVNALGELHSPPITDVFIRNGVYYQYTLAYLMVYNPDAPVGQQYRIFPLGRDLKIDQKPAQVSLESDLVVEGYVIWQELVPLYRLYGANLIGPPITELLYNKDQNRFEQYFTNMAFYRYVDSREGNIGLMPYGAWYCSEQCDAAYTTIETEFFPLPPEGRFIYNRQEQVRLALDTYAQRLGIEYTGEPLSDVQLNPDGFYTRIYENVVMIVDPRYMNDIQFLDLPEEVGVIPDEPEPQKNDPELVFFPIRTGLGFNIPRAIFDFITMHGSIEVSGPPIKRMYQLDNGGIGQCFEHICLEYMPNAPKEGRVRVLPLGRDYFRKLAGTPQVASDQPLEPQTINVKVWERYPLLAPGQVQEIGVAVFQGTEPQKNMNFYITLLLPDGSQRVDFLPPTGGDGQTHIVLEAVELPKGTMVPYQICVAAVSEGITCLNESFLIWEEE
jgi:hypothetical protein